MENQPPGQADDPLKPEGEGAIGVAAPEDSKLPWRDDSDTPLDQEPPKPPAQTPSPTVPSPKPNRNTRALVIAATVLVVAILAFGIYHFLLKPKPAAKKSSTTSSTASSSQSTHAASQIDSQSKTYTSPNFNLSFSYPADWTITDNGGGIMTAKSPAISLKNPSGQTVNGIIILTIRDHSQKLTEFNSGNATATRDSVKVAYTKPAQTQRANTYLSFLQYASTTASGALDGVYITGDNGYQKGQAIPLVDIQKVDPIISVTFSDTAGKGISTADSAWNDTAFSGPLQTMLESFSIN